MFTGVYEPILRGKKEELREKLGATKGVWEDPWCLGGDSNSIKFPRERRNC